MARNQLILANLSLDPSQLFGKKNPHNFRQIFAINWQKKANLSSKKANKALWAKYHLGHNVLFGQIVTLGIKSFGKMSSWAYCHIGHKVFGQYVTMGILSLGILKTWAF